MNFLRYSLASSVMIFGLTVVADAKTSYEITRKKGEVWIKTPFDTEWKKVKHKAVPMGSLIRIDPLSSIEFTLKTEDGEKPPILRKYRIERPLITRLDEDLVRRMRIDPYPLKDVWQLGLEAEKTAAESPVLSFVSSFVRSIVTLDKTPSLPDIESTAPEKEDLEIAGETTPIEILSPEKGSLFFLENDKVKIPLVWMAPKEGLTFKIYVWPEDEPRKEALWEQRETFYAVTLSKAGNYRVQIEDSTRKFRSDAVAIRVENELTSQAGSVAAADKEELSLEFPKDRSIVFSQSAKKGLDFSWTSVGGLKQNETYRLYLKKEGRTTVVRDLKQTMTTVGLTPGLYTWYIEKVDRESRVRSRSRQVHIEEKTIKDLFPTVENAKSRDIFLNW